MARNYSKSRYSTLIFAPLADVANGHISRDHLPYSLEHEAFQVQRSSRICH